MPQYLYRVAYGQGQVSQSFKTKHEALQHIAAMDQYRAFAFVQKFDCEAMEWFAVRGTKGAPHV